MVGGGWEWGGCTQTTCHCRITIKRLCKSNRSCTRRQRAGADERTDVRCRQVQAFCEKLISSMEHSSTVSYTCVMTTNWIRAVNWPPAVRQVSLCSSAIFLSDAPSCSRPATDVTVPARAGAASLNYQVEWGSECAHIPAMLAHQVIESAGRGRCCCT